MHYIPVLGLGTYYTKHGAARNSDVPGVAELRRWAFLAKDNGPPSPVTVRHPNHPDSRRFNLSTPAHAYWYAAGVGKALIPEAFMDL
ncbi:MAG TPA: hypothetical protein VGJ91_12060, partial [Polyangiaceae bacterium]